MPRRPLTYNAALVLQAILRGHPYGFEVLAATHLPSGTVYPILRRLEGGGLVRSRWEDEAKAHAEGRPRRRYYEVTRAGEAALEEALRRIAAQQRLLQGALEGAE